jgi:hypothetical protein
VTGESILACRPGGAELQFRHFPLAPGSMLACEISDPHVEYYRWHYLWPLVAESSIVLPP